MNDTLKEFFSKHASEFGVSFAVLFGSVARGKTHKESDLDIAISFTEKQKTLENILKLQKTLVDSIGKEDIEIVDLQHGSPTLKMNVAKEGVLLYEMTSDSYIFWKLYVRKEWQDTLGLRVIRERQLSTL